MSTLHIRLFGDFQISSQGKPLGGFEAPRLQSLLAFLVLHRDAPQSRKHLAFLLWQDSSEQQAHGNLRNLVHRLRKGLPDAERFLLADAQTLQWRADAPFTLDVDEFQKAAAQPDSAVALQSAVNLYRGDLLPACYDEWLLPEREHLRDMFVDTLAQLIGLSETAHEYQAAISYARRLLQADPLGEQVYLKLMDLYARTGDRANVVRVYQTCVAVLKRELDTEPSAATREAFERLRRQEVRVERAIVPRGKVKPNLPVPLTSFIGRARELEEIRSLLKRARLVTLTGVGGGGKTRLAIQVAHEVAAEFPDGAWFVDFAPLSDPAEVPSTCAAVLGLREQADVSASRLLADYARDKEMLLVLDNCEHLLSACLALAQNLLENAPRVRILATSREPLNLLGEALLIVPPLSLPHEDRPTLETLAHSDAVRLFIARAGFNLPTFNLNHGNLEAVARICMHLDGIPLAIELAAARVRTLTPAQIAARLDDALAVLTRGSSTMPARHQTMRGVLDWSDALLSEQERALFRRFSIFAGGFTLEAAERVCSDGQAQVGESGTAHESRPLSIPRSLILDLLSNLIDKSLVTAADVEQGEQARYRLLEPIRQYAREKLQSACEYEKFAARHLAWCVELGEQMQAELEGVKQAAGLVRLEREHDNLRGALEFALHSEHRASGLSLATALERFWLIGGHAGEGRAWLEQLLAPETLPGHTGASTIPANPPLRARALTVAGLLAHRQNNYDKAEACYQESLRVWQALHDQEGIALVLKHLGDVTRTRGEYARSVEFLQQSLDLWRKLGNTKGIANTLYSLGGTFSEQGDYARASALYQEGLTIARQLGDLWLIAIFINNLGVAARIQDPDRAEAMFLETLTIRRSLGDRYGEAISLRNLGELGLQRQDWARAREMFEASLSLHQSMDNAKGEAECFVGLAWVEYAQARPARAAQLLGMSERLREMIHAPVPEDDRAEYDDLVNRVRAGLDPGVFESAWASGHTQTFGQSDASARAKPS